MSDEIPVNRDSKHQSWFEVVTDCSNWPRSTEAKSTGELIPLNGWHPNIVPWTRTQAPTPQSKQTD